METFSDFAGLMRVRPGLALCMTIFSLSALGLPPFSGLWGKFFVFKAAWEGGVGLGAAAVAALVGSVVAAFYYLRLVKVMWLDPAPGPTDSPIPIAQAAAYAMALFAFPAVLAALYWLDPAAHVAAAALAQR
jgi:NADH-quinone oxidoreductase subunit N